MDDQELNRVVTHEYYRIEKFWKAVPDQSQYEGNLDPQVIRDLFGKPRTQVRTMPLAIDHPDHYVLETTVALPEHWALQDAREAVEHPAARLTLTRTYRNRTLVMRYEYEALTNCVAAADVTGYLAAVERMEDLLGYTLTWPDPALSPSGSGLNWPILFAACFYGVLGAALIYRRRQDGPPPLPPAVGPAAGPRGIGGWLILISIGLVLNPILVMVTIARNCSAYSLSTWNTLTVPGSDQYHGWWAPLLLFELLANMTVLIWSLLLLLLFFGKRRSFRRLYIAFLIFAAFFAALDSIGLSRIPAAVDEFAKGSMLTALGRSIVTVAIWVPYMLVSKRVRSTFVN